MVKISICCRLLTTEVHNLVECHKHTHHCHDMEKIQSFKGLIPGSCTMYIAKLPLRRQVPSFPPICIERFFFFQHKHCVLLLVQLKKIFFQQKGYSSATKFTIIMILQLQTTELVII